MEVLQRICLQFEKGRKIQIQQQEGKIFRTTIILFYLKLFCMLTDSNFKLIRSTRKNSVVIQAAAPSELAVSLFGVFLFERI